MLGPRYQYIPHYDCRLVKLISPINNEIFSLELNGDENELRELISTILNIPATSIKGIRDIFGNYYTLSSAIKNPHLTAEFSSVYFIVIANALTLPRKDSLYMNKNMTNMSPMRKYVNSQMTTTIVPMIDNLNGMNNIQENKRDSFPNYNSKNMKNNIVKKNSADDSNYQNRSFNTIIDNIEDNFDSKSDVDLLRKLILCDNKQIISAMDQYEIDNDQKKLIDTLNAILDGYRSKLNSNNTTLMDIKVNDDPVPIPVEKVDFEHNMIPKAATSSKRNSKKDEEKAKKKKIEKISKKIKKFITDNAEKIRFDVVQIFNHDLSTMTSIQKQTLFFDVLNIQDTSSITKALIPNIQKYYIKIIQNKFLVNLNEDEIKVYTALIEEKDEIIFQKYKDIVLDKNDVDLFRKSIKEYIDQVIDEQINANPEENEEEENEGESDEVNSSSLEKEESEIEEEKESESNEYVIDTTKNKKNNQEVEARTNKGSGNEGLMNKKLKEFVKVINKMAFSEENKKELLELLSHQDAMMIKIFENFQKNKMSLTKKVLMGVINKKGGSSNPPSSTKTGFEGLIEKMKNKGLIDDKVYNFIISRYNDKDEMLCSFWEVYSDDNDEDDFIDNIEIFIKKYQNLIDKFTNEGSSGGDKLKKVLDQLLKEGNFDAKDKEIALREYEKQNAMLMSILESLDPDDVEDSIDTLRTLIKKMKHVKS